jgi:hypothetical protein
LGNIPVKIDWFNIDVRDGEITVAKIFKIQEEIPTIPDALLGLNSLPPHPSFVVQC